MNDRCISCGILYAQHSGLQGTCKEAMDARADLATLRNSAPELIAELERLREVNGRMSVALAKNAHEDKAWLHKIGHHCEAESRLQASADRAKHCLKSIAALGRIEPTTKEPSHD